MNLNWYTSESTVRPKELDLDSSPTNVYFRRNIHTEERTDPDTGETTTYFVYEEAKVAKTEYAAHLAAQIGQDIIAAEQEITEQDLALLEAEQEITDMDLRIMELENAQEGLNDEA